MYKIYIERSVFKQLKKIPENDYQKIISAIKNLADKPRPSGCKKLKVRPGYRIRQGNYRIIYEINDKVLTVTVISVGDRKDIY